MECEYEKNICVDLIKIYAFYKDLRIVETFGQIYYFLEKNKKGSARKNNGKNFRIFSPKLSIY